MKKKSLNPQRGSRNGDWVKMPRCPKCRSEEIIILDKELGFIRCNACGYSNLEEENSFSERGMVGERKSQREKARYSPYKMGGKRRTKK